LGTAAPLALLLVGGRTVVDEDRLTTADDRQIATELVAAHRKLVNG